MDSRAAAGRRDILLREPVCGGTGSRSKVPAAADSGGDCRWGFGCKISSVFAGGADESFRISWAPAEVSAAVDSGWGGVLGDGAVSPVGNRLGCCGGSVFDRSRSFFRIPAFKFMR